MFILHASEVKAWPSYLNPRFTKSYSFKSDSACYPFDVTQLANMQNTCNSITCPHSTSCILFCNYNLASQVAQWRRTHLPSRRPKFDPWGGKISWGRKWQLTPVSLPEKCHGQRSLGGYSSWGHNKSDTTEWLSSSSIMFTDWNWISSSPALFKNEKEGIEHLLRIWHISCSVNNLVNTVLPLDRYYIFPLHDVKPEVWYV